MPKLLKFFLLLIIFSSNSETFVWAGDISKVSSILKDPIKIIDRGKGLFLIDSIELNEELEASLINSGLENQLKDFNVLSFFWNHHFKKSIFERQKLEGVFFITCYLGLDLSY